MNKSCFTDQQISCLHQHWHCFCQRSSVASLCTRFVLMDNSSDLMRSSMYLYNWLATGTRNYPFPNVRSSSSFSGAPPRMACGFVRDHNAIINLFRLRRGKTAKLSYCATREKSCFARSVCAFFILVHFGAVVVLSTKRNDLFFSCMDDVNTWRQIFFLCFHLQIAPTI